VRPRFDVVVIGEMLVELSSTLPLAVARELRLSFSGDALNAAAAAARAGASVGLLTRVGDDEFGERLIQRAEHFGIDTSLVHRVPRPNGVYITSADPDGSRQFVYLRSGSAATTLGPDDLPIDVLSETRAVMVSGIACAISPSSQAAVERAAQVVDAAGGIVVYDPNFRPRLATAEAARAVFRKLAPHSAVITPSCPADALALLDTDDPAAAAQACRNAGADAAAVTLGSEGVLLADGQGQTMLPAVPAPAVVDATGCGDVFAGTLTARLSLGDSLRDAARLGAAAASLSVGGVGGLGRVATWDEVTEHLETALLPGHGSEMAREETL
jgi:2-dehydro-3-deoxygluconokinase